jgi:hypothetical protein
MTLLVQEKLASKVERVRERKRESDRRESIEMREVFASGVAMVYRYTTPFVSKINPGFFGSRDVAMTC